ncbi:hypothetical protein LSAT2_031332, partial [Lamellibrachia satsuma]
SCQRHPCKNGGTCYDKPGGSYVCVCPNCGCSSVRPFGDCIIDKATICKKEDLPPKNLVSHPYLCNKFYDSVKVCADITCANGGTCTNNQGGFKCDCAPGYTGKTFDLESCSGDYCQNGGTCTDTTDETAACIEHSKKPRYSGSNNFYLGHPYRCEWFVRCFSGRGVSMRCAPPSVFNPDYAGDQPCSNDNNCTQT